MTLDELPELATALEVAKVLRCSKSFVQHECQKGALECRKIANRFLITPDAVRRYLEEATVPCLDRTKDSTSTSTSNSAAGSSANSSEELNAVRCERDLAAAERLIARASKKSSTGSKRPPARVIPLRG